MGEDFNLYSSLEDALHDLKPWQFCNYDYSYGNVGFPRDCGPHEASSNQWNTFKPNGADAFGSKLQYQFQIVAIDDKYYSSDTHFNEWM